MSLIESTTDKAKSQNIATEVRASGKPIKQAVAIGYSVQRKARKQTSSRMGSRK